MSCARSFWPDSSSSSSARFVAQSPSDSAGSDSMSSDTTRSAQQTSGTVGNTDDDTGGAGETCDVCGMAEGTWRKCKLVCRNCGTILKSCADL